MLSRTAGNLYWAGRYVERADSLARLLAMGARMTMLPGATTRRDWQSVMQAAGFHVEEGDDMIGRPEAIERLLLAPEGNSLRACFDAARHNIRAERTTVTTLMWEAMNDDWRALENVSVYDASQNLMGYVDWAQSRAAKFRGAIETSMLRDDRYDFLRLGWMLERAAGSLRLLDVKYLALLPERDVVGGGRDTHQWTSLLLAANALRAYHHVYKGDVSAWNVADLLLLNPAFPRSVCFCTGKVRQALDNLATRYDQPSECNDRIAILADRLTQTDINTVFDYGLHEFVQEALRNVFELHASIAKSYGY